MAVDSEIELDKTTLALLETLVTQEVSGAAPKFEQTEILDARTESRLRFNAIVAAWVVRARMVASAGPVNQVEVDAVYWPDDEEWEIEAIETI